MKTINQTYFKYFPDLTSKSKKEIMEFEMMIKSKRSKKQFQQLV